MTLLKPQLPNLLPTGVPVETVANNDPAFLLGNTLTIYGIPNAMRIVAVLKDYKTTNSFYSYVSLVKLATDFGTAYSSSALAISLGRDAIKEQEDFQLLYRLPDVLALPSLDKVQFFYADTDNVLDQITNWFGYSSLSSADILAEPSLYIDWLKEAGHGDLFPSMNIVALDFFTRLSGRYNMPITSEIKFWIQEVFG